MSKKTDLEPILRSDVGVFITHYNRPDMLRALVRQLDGYSVTVFDDHSKRIPIVPSAEVIRADQHLGREGFWQIINLVSDYALNNPHKYYLLLPDDFTAEPNAVERAVKLWQTIKTGRKIALNVVNCGRESQWGKKRASFNKDLYQSWGVDGAFLCERDFFKVIHPLSQPWGTANSSGVWLQATRKVRRRFFYQVKKTLFHHADHTSLMNPDRAEALTF